MSNIDNIINTLKEKGDICDDCLSMITNILPRQTVNKLCRNSAETGEIQREKSKCIKCQKLKILNNINTSYRENKITSDTFEQKIISNMESAVARNVVLISCVKSKVKNKSQAIDMYTSDLFKKNLAYSKILNPSATYILSAKYGLVKLNDTISPYDLTLKNMKLEERKEWALKVVKQLELVENIENTNFIFLAGERYREYLLPKINNYEVPMKGLSFGNQLNFLKEKINRSKDNPCNTIHRIFKKMTRFHFPFDDKEIPKNGIYILYEESEIGHRQDRIVRVGTHKGINQLRSRLKQHFIHEKKDRSIFRKNIGRSLLNKENDDFIEQWEWDLTSRKNKDKYSQLVDFNKQETVEQEVSKHIQNKMSFVVFEVQEKEERLQLESLIISTVSLCKECGASKNWLGNNSTKDKIKKSGLWLVNELYKKPLNIDGIARIRKLCNIKS